MTKEQCSLQPNYYGSSCDFQDLQSAVQQLTTKSDAQFEELKNEKWFHRIFNMVVCPRKNNIRMAEQITDRKSTRLNPSHSQQARMPTSA